MTALGRVVSYAGVLFGMVVLVLLVLALLGIYDPLADIKDALR